LEKKGPRERSVAGGKNRRRREKDDLLLDVETGGSLKGGKPYVTGGRRG